MFYNMNEITSLKIIYFGSNTWGFRDNNMGVSDSRGSEANSGTWDIDLVTFKTKSGGIIYDRVPYTVIEYIDTIDSGNSFIPTSAEGLIAQLKSIGFFDVSNSGGGSTDIALPGLTDAGFSNYFGRGGQLLRVAENELVFETFEANFAESFLDLNDTPNNYIPNYVLQVNSTGTGVRFVPISNLAQPFLQYKQQRIKFKGYQWLTVSSVLQKVGNTQLLEQPGDIMEGWLTDGDPEDIQASWFLVESARWIGGDLRRMSSYMIAEYKTLPFETDPDF